jgi:hypothetical protein
LQALATGTIVCAPAGHKKTASSEWGGNWGNDENESQNEKKTAATAFQSFRRAAGWAAPRIIHWWLIAFTVQNYKFLFRCNNLPVKNILYAKFPALFLALKPVNTTCFAAFPVSKKNQVFLTACLPSSSRRNFGRSFR